MTDRGVSSTLNYVLSLGIATILVTGLLLAGGSFVTDRQETVIRSELEVIGQQVSSDLARMDRLATAGDGVSTLQMTRPLPERLAGSAYRISIPASGDEIVLTSSDPSVEVTVQANTRVALGESFAGGGPIDIRYETSTDQLVIDDV